MNREILFKAKRKNWKELPKEEWWVEGYLFDDGMPEPKHYFIGGIIVKPHEGAACDKWNVVGIDFCEIDINTLCQYTGLEDNNGKRIWENDILVEKHKGIITMKYRVVFDLEEGAWMLETKSGARYGIGAVNQRHFEVCGNIFDDSKLLEE